jgi:hypothetical protein
VLSNATICRPANGLVPEQKCTGTSAGVMTPERGLRGLADRLC